MADRYANSLASVVLILPLCLIFILGSKYIKEESDRKFTTYGYNIYNVTKVANAENKKLEDTLDNEHEKINCKWPPLKLRTNGPTTSLASKPGSGNTWVRHLLQLATGIQTGSIFHEMRLKRNGFPGEGITDGTVIAIKTHNLKT